MNCEERFYASHGRVEIVRPSADTVEEFAAGRRYAICNQSLKLIPPLQKNIIAELGCGSGDRLLYLQERHGFDHAIGIDLGFRSKIRCASSDFLPANLNEPWPLGDASVDVLIAMMLLEHLFDPWESFREINRVLSRHGRAFVNLPLVTSIKNRARLLAGRLPITSVPYFRWEHEGHWDGFHLHYFTIGSIRDLAKHSDLRVVSFRSVGKYSGFKQLAPSLLCDEISFELRKRTSC
jgi:SAM-dependent methyltransferase